MRKCTLLLAGLLISSLLSGQQKDCYPNCIYTFKEVKVLRVPFDFPLTGLPFFDTIIKSKLNAYVQNDSMIWPYLRNVACAHKAGWEEYTPGACTAGGPPPCCPLLHWFQDPKAWEKFNAEMDAVKKQRIRELQSISDQGLKIVRCKDMEILVDSLKKQLAQLQSFIDNQKKNTDELLKKMADALSGFNSSELTVTRKNGKVYISMQEGLLFPSGSAVVNSKGKDALSKVAATLLKISEDISIEIEGHTDSIPIHNKLYADNWALSTARATSIAHVMIDEYNVPPARLVASGHSCYEPVAPNNTAEGRAANRRTEIILEPRLDELMQLLYGK